MRDNTEQRSGLILKQMSRAAESLERVARALRNSSKGFDEEGYSYVSRWGEGLAAKIDGASEYLRESDLEDLARDARRLIREEPIISLAGAFAAGFLVARFLKSSGIRNSKK